MARLRSAVRIHPTAALVFTAVLLASVFLANPYLRGDGNGYYAWLRSPVIDGDLRFGDEFARGDPAFLATVYDANGRYLPGMVTETGYIRDQWSVGPALFWAPFFLLAHAFVLVERALGVGTPADGFSTPYLWASAIGTALYAAIGLLLSYRVAITVTRTGPAVLGTIAVWLASSLPIYQYLLPFWPFGVGVFVAALLLAVWHREGWDLRRWLALGVLSGLVTIVHPVAVTWVLLPLASIAGLDGGELRQRLRALPVFALGGVVGAAPQLIGKTIVNGSPFDTGYQVQWSFLHPDFGRVLFGAAHGMISWTPVLALAVAGLWVVGRRNRRLGLGLAIVFAAMLYLVASYATSEQSSFGNRFFVLFTPGFVVGAAALFDVLWTKRAVLVGIVAALVIWNALFMFQWAWGLVPKRGPVDWGQMARQQFTTAPTEFVRAVGLFFTDRGQLLRIVEQQDLRNTRSNRDVAGT